MIPYRQYAATASNVKGGPNPPFTEEDFRTLYPHFWGQDGPLVPQVVLEMYVQFGHCCVKKSRYRGAWEYCIGLFVAHFLTLYLQSIVDPEDTDAKKAVAAGQARGVTASKSVDGVSVSYDFTAANQDLEGWAAWTLTTYGAQFATMAKMYGKGGMYVL